MKLIDSQDVSGIVRRTLGYVDSRLVHHGERVAYRVMKMMQCRGGYSDEEIRDYCFLALIHDIGAYKTEEIDNMLHFETGNVWNHSIYGYLFVKYLSPLKDLAPGILYHHLNFNRLVELHHPQEMLAQMIHLADRVDVLWEEKRDQIGEILTKLEGTQFSGEVIDLFLRSTADGCNYEIPDVQKSMDELLSVLNQAPFSEKEINKILWMVVSAIDFRSHYTIIHTITTTSISFRLGELMGITGEALEKIEYGALLHDLGKIGVPVEILEYPGRLSPQGMDVMRGHVNITEQIMNGEIDDTISKISLRHHEKLDGSGYPRGLCGEELTESERIVAVADIISALCGKRSYKEAYDRERTVRIIREQADAGLISSEIVKMAIDHFDEIMEYTSRKTEPVLRIYHTMQEEYGRLLNEQMSTVSHT